MQQAIPGRSFHRIALTNAVHCSSLQQPLTKGYQVMISIVRCRSRCVVFAAYGGMLPHLQHRIVNSCDGFESDGSIHWLSCHDLGLVPTCEGSYRIARYDTRSPFSYAFS